MEAGVRPISRSSTGSAQSKMEYYLRAESRLSQIPKPEPLNDESKGQYAWRMIRHCVRDAIDLTIGKFGFGLALVLFMVSVWSCLGFGLGLCLVLGLGLGSWLKVSDMLSPMGVG